MSRREAMFNEVEFLGSSAKRVGNPKKSRLRLLIYGILITSMMCAAQERPLKVFICVGQSNMLGRRSIAAELPPALQIPQKNLFFNGKTWIPVAPGKTGKAGFGPEIAFAQQMSERLKEPVGIIKYSVGGTNLAEQWSSKAKKSDAKGKEGLYHKMLDLVLRAQKNRNIEIVGMIWMQGESDSRTEDFAKAYADNLTDFINASRNDLKSPEMIFISGRINPLKSKFPYVDMVREAQEDCSVSYYGFINCDQLPKGGDHLHYTTAGIVEMGNLFATKMESILRSK